MRMVLITWLVYQHYSSSLHMSKPPSIRKSADCECPTSGHYWMIVSWCNEAASVVMTRPFDSGPRLDTCGVLKCRCLGALTYRAKTSNVGELITSTQNHFRLWIEIWFDLFFLSFYSTSRLYQGSLRGLTVKLARPQGHFKEEIVLKNILEDILERRRKNRSRRSYLAMRVWHRNPKCRGYGACGLYAAR